MKTSLELTHISKFFEDNSGEKIEVLKDVSFQVAPGEFVCIVGPSGGGKSTLLRIIAGLIEPSSGQVERAGENIGFVFQNFALFPWLSVEENIGYGLKMRGMDEARIRTRVRKEIARMGLADFHDAHPKELSGGMKQRVGIARALAVDPSILILDEPFSALDELTAKRLREDVLNIWHETKATIIMVTHLVDEAVYLADRIISFTARPAHIVKNQENMLKRPRNTRSREFYALSDAITRQIQS